MIFIEKTAHFRRLKKRVTQGPTIRPSDRRTDTNSYRDARTHLKKEKKRMFLLFLPDARRVQRFQINQKRKKKGKKRKKTRKPKTNFVVRRTGEAVKKTRECFKTFISTFSGFCLLPSSHFTTSVSKNSLDQ